MVTKTYKIVLILIFLSLIRFSGCAPSSHVRLGLDVHVPAEIPDLSGADSLTIGKPSP